jgi:ubiquitin carboxyl-terminal hydrolase 4/11/15
MFELCYFTSVKEMIPSGWNVVDEDKTYATLSSRNPQLQQPVDDESSNGYELANGRGSSASSEDSTYQDTADSSNTRMVDESSEDDEPVAASSRVSPLFSFKNSPIPSMSFPVLANPLQILLSGHLTED